MGYSDFKLVVNIMKKLLNKIIELRTNCGKIILGYFVKPKDNIWLIGRMSIHDFQNINLDSNGNFSLFGMFENKEISIPNAAFGHVEEGDECVYVDILPFEIMYGHRFDAAKMMSFLFSLPELDNFFFQNIIQANSVVSYPATSFLPEPEVSINLSEAHSDCKILLERSYQFENSRSNFSISSENCIVVVPSIELDIQEIIQFAACARFFFSLIMMEHVNLPSRIQIVYRDDGEDSYKLTVLWLNDNSKYYTQHKEHPAKILFNDIKASLPLLWSKWIQFWNNKDNQPLIKIYSDVFSSKSVGSNRYLNICHALEHYSKKYRRREAKKVQEEKGNKNDNVWLSTRFLDLLRLFNEFFDLSKEELEGKSKKLANMRNYLSHFDEKDLENKEKVNHFAEMRVDYDLENFAFRLFMVVVFSQLEIPNETIKKALSSSKTIFANTLENMFYGPNRNEWLKNI